MLQYTALSRVQEGAGSDTVLSDWKGLPVKLAWALICCPYT